MSVRSNHTKQKYQDTLKRGLRVYVKNVVDEITAIISKFGCAITADIYGQKHSAKRLFLLATIHYINDESEQHSRVLFAAPFDEYSNIWH